MRKRVAELDKYPVQSEVPQVQRPVWKGYGCRGLNIYLHM